MFGGCSIDLLSSSDRCSLDFCWVFVESHILKCHRNGIRYVRMLPARYHGDHNVVKVGSDMDVIDVCWMIDSCSIVVR